MAAPSKKNTVAERVQFRATLLVILAVAISAFISTSILSQRIARVESMLLQLSVQAGIK